VQYHRVEKQRIFRYSVVAMLHLVQGRYAPVGDGRDVEGRRLKRGGRFLGGPRKLSEHPSHSCRRQRNLNLQT
jgi:hypothetical protein